MNPPQVYMCSPSWKKKSHSWKLMIRKLSKHKTNKEKISSHHVKSAYRGAHCCGKFWEKHKIFSWWWYLLLAGISYKMKKIPPHISIPKSWLLSRDSTFSNLVPPHPSFVYTPRHCMYWNTTLIRAKTVFFLSLFISTWQGPLCKIMKYFQLTPHSFYWILL